LPPVPPSASLPGIEAVVQGSHSIVLILGLCKHFALLVLQTLL
jgi:hypothetical protein